MTGKISLVCLGVLLGTVLYEAVAYEYQWPLLSNGLIVVKDVVAHVAHRIGYVMGCIFNPFEWWQWIRPFVRHFFQPIYDALVRLLGPTAQIAGSWVYFLWGLSEVRYANIATVSLMFVVWAVVVNVPDKVWRYMKREDWVSYSLLLSMTVALGAGLCYDTDLFNTIQANFQQWYHK